MYKNSHQGGNGDSLLSSPAVKYGAGGLALILTVAIIAAAVNGPKKKAMKLEAKKGIFEGRANKIEQKAGSKMIKNANDYARNAKKGVKGRKNKKAAYQAAYGEYIAKHDIVKQEAA
jgi:hypothetical protein